jgi:peptide/nickel transport system substrate-binding protein
MKRKVIWAMLSFIMALSLVLSACAKEATPTPTATTPKPTALTPTATTSAPIATAPAPTTTQANWWDKFGEPKYGGTLTVRVDQVHTASIEPLDWMGRKFQSWLDWFTSPGWLLDRNEWAFKSNYIPTEYCTGLLAERWEQTDPTTVTVYIRKGVHWQDKPPVNGREFTADDVVYNYDRMLGTGSGFTQPDPVSSGSLTTIERVVATDKYTVQFKLKEPSAFAMSQVLTGGWKNMYAPESAQLEGGHMEDWANAVGTGPFILTDYVSSVSLVLSKNPNYWGYDERHPENQLPYIDTLKYIAIEDMTTSLAAMRTGKIDLIADQNTATWQQVQSLAKTNPEISVGWWPSSGPSVQMRCDHAPFTDIKVRKALQMAIDRQAMAKTNYGGTVDGKPAGVMHPMYTGWCTPYDQWPQDLKDEYSYNPTKAKALLTEAGYPNGFKTSCVASNIFDLQLLQVIKDEFKDIGVDMDISAMDMPTFDAFVKSGKHDQLAYARDTGYAGEPSENIQSLTTGNRRNYTYNNDSHYDELYNKMLNAPSIDEAKKLSVEADMYALRQHWTVYVCTLSCPWALWQPWVKGYSGEVVLEGNPILARLWIDQDLKESMGR